MSKPQSEMQSIRSTMDSQFRKTMTVVEAIQDNTEKLLTKTESIIAILSDEEMAAEAEIEQEIAGEIAEEILEEEILEEEIREATKTPATHSHHHSSGQHKPDGHLLDKVQMVEITKACVSEVMSKINPVLESLDKFIKANALDKKPMPEVDDDAFAAKLIEEMKQSLGRRQRIALARKRMTPT